MKNRPGSLFAACLFCLCLVAGPAVGAEPLPPAGALSAGPALALMDRLGDRLTIIDVRTEEEYAQGHIPGALLIPLQKLDASMGSVPADRPVLLVCRTGRRAEAAYSLIAGSRPNPRLWFLRGSPEYRPDRTFTFN